MIYNHGNGIYIDGIDNYAFDLDIVISNNVIKRNFKFLTHVIVRDFKSSKL